MRIIEASNMSPYDKMKAFDNGTRRENLGACKVDKLITYYKVTLSHGFRNARAGIEAELEKRDLADFIVPTACLNNPSPKLFDDDVAKAVIDAKGDIAVVLHKAQNAFSYSTVIVTAYVMALVFGEHAIAQSLEQHIRRIGTYDSLMHMYLDNCASDPALVDHLTTLSRTMEAYKSWA
jgi:hypothetical protein